MMIDDFWILRIFQGFASIPSPILSPGLSAALVGVTRDHPSPRTAEPLAVAEIRRDRAAECTRTRNLQQEESESRPNFHNDPLKG
ncbi:MAG TPA: hypothetical protein VMV69_25565 [Pirellulales bacterium]|nr:hypothetical protein [Pirellulales bacterium]